MRFTDKGIAALKAKAERYEKWEDGRSGFGVRVSTEGRKSFVFMYRFDGKARRMTLGRYPALSLASARVLLAKAKELLDDGRDPGALAMTDKRKEREAETVKELVDEYLERSAKSKRSYAEIKRVLHREVLPAWEGRKVKSITRRDVRVLANGIADRGAPVMANRTLQYVNRMFRFGISADMLTVNPCTGVERPSDERERERVLAAAEIKSFWSKLPATDMTPAVQLVLKLLLATGQRRGEVVGIDRAELDHGARIWTIPSTRTKNKLIHLVPLTDLAMDLIDEAVKTCADRRWLFPSPMGDQPIKPPAITAALRRNADVLGIGDATVHDLRRTCQTGMTERGITRFIADRVLNHKEPGVGRRYDRYDYLKEKRAALELWGQGLEELIAGKKRADGNVVPLRTA